MYLNPFSYLNKNKTENEVHSNNKSKLSKNNNKLKKNKINKLKTTITIIPTSETIEKQRFDTLLPPLSSLNE